MKLMGLIKKALRRLTCRKGCWMEEVTASDGMKYIRFSRPLVSVGDLIPFEESGAVEEVHVSTDRTNESNHS